MKVLFQMMENELARRLRFQEILKRLCLLFFRFLLIIAGIFAGVEDLN